jgi:hypothetical protein
LTAALSSVPPPFLDEASVAFSWSVLAMSVIPAIGGSGKRRALSSLKLVAPVAEPLSKPVAEEPKATGFSLPKPVAKPVSEPVKTAAKASVPKPLSSEAAAREFARQMIEAGADTLAWKRVVHNYRWLAAEYGWPPLADKDLEIFLKRMGCVKRVSPRRKDGSRPTIVTFPLKLKGPKAR